MKQWHALYFFLYSYKIITLYSNYPIEYVIVIIFSPKVNIWRICLSYMKVIGNIALIRLHVFCLVSLDKIVNNWQKSTRHVSAHIDDIQFKLILVVRFQQMIFKEEIPFHPLRTYSIKMRKPIWVLMEYKYWRDIAVYIQSCPINHNKQGIQKPSAL